MPSDSQQPDAPPGSAPCSCSARRFKTKVCKKCGTESLGLGWPYVDLCKQCHPLPRACPFCGCTGCHRVKENDGSAAWLECSVCHARGPRQEIEGMAEPMWNRRREPNEKGQR